VRNCGYYYLFVFNAVLQKRKEGDKRKGQRVNSCRPVNSYIDEFLSNYFTDLKFDFLDFQRRACLIISQTHCDSTVRLREPFGDVFWVLIARVQQNMYGNAERVGIKNTKLSTNVMEQNMK